MASTPYSAVTPQGAQGLDSLVEREHQGRLQGSQIAAQQGMQQQELDAQQQMQQSGQQHDAQMREMQHRQTQGLQVQGQEYDREQQELHRAFTERENARAREIPLEIQRIQIEARRARLQGDTAKVAELTKRASELRRKSGESSAAVIKATLLAGKTRQEADEAIRRAEEAITDRMNVGKQNVDTAQGLAKTIASSVVSESAKADADAAGSMSSLSGQKLDDGSMQAGAEIGALMGFSLLDDDNVRVSGTGDPNAAMMLVPGMKQLVQAAEGAAALDVFNPGKTRDSLGKRIKTDEEIREIAKTRLVESALKVVGPYSKSFDPEKARPALMRALESGGGQAGDAAAVTQGIVDAGLSPEIVAHAFNTLQEEFSSGGETSIRTKARNLMATEVAANQGDKSLKHLGAEAMVKYLDALTEFSGKGGDAFGVLNDTTVYEGTLEALRRSLEHGSVSPGDRRIMEAAGLDADPFSSKMAEWKKIADELEMRKSLGFADGAADEMDLQAAMQQASLDGDLLEMEALGKGLDGLVGRAR